MWSHPNPFAVVLCTYNGARFLDLQLHSLRDQEGVAEIVICDDGSTDGTMDILQRHAVEDPRLRVSRNTRNLGVTANFEQAISLARSPWIALADQDDIWLPGKLARIRARWDGESCLVHHASAKFRGAAMPRHTGHRVVERRKFSGRNWRRLLYRNSVVGHTVVFQAKLAARLVPFPRAVLHDWWLGAGAALYGNVQFVDECLVHYRMHCTNSYHTAGSRWRRLRAEADMRAALLQAVLARRILPAEERDFAAEYLAVLHGARTGEGLWKLWSFYCRHAVFFFGSAHFEPSKFTCLRKSFTAALAGLIPPERSRRRPGAMLRGAARPD